MAEEVTQAQETFTFAETAAALPPERWRRVSDQQFHDLWLLLRRSWTAPLADEEAQRTRFCRIMAYLFEHHAMDFGLVTLMTEYCDEVDPNPSFERLLSIALEDYVARNLARRLGDNKMFRDFRTWYDLRANPQRVRQRLERFWEEQRQHLARHKIHTLAEP